MNSFFPVFNLPSKSKEIFPTGLPKLDKVIGEGFQIGDLCLMMSPPVRGKTAFCASVLEENSDNDVLINDSYKGSNDEKC